MTKEQRGSVGFPAYDRADPTGSKRRRPGMKFRLVVQHDAESQRWSATFPEIPGCATAGDTEQEAITNAKEAVALWFEPRDLELQEGARILEVAIP
ncbi:MAG: type II toxin-antitoxin system HicB family antitoxin [Vicinamibacteria bacterium]